MRYIARYPIFVGNNNNDNNNNNGNLQYLQLQYITNIAKNVIFPQSWLVISSFPQSWLVISSFPTGFYYLSKFHCKSRSL